MRSICPSRHCGTDIMYSDSCLKEVVKVLGGGAAQDSSFCYFYAGRYLGMEGLEIISGTYHCAVIYTIMHYGEGIWKAI